MTSRSWPSISSPPCSSTRCATSGSTYAPKASRSASRSESPSIISLKLPASWPISSAEVIGTRASRSPLFTASVAFSSASTGWVTERVTSSVSSSEIVNATSNATTTSNPRSSSCAVPLVDSPLTTTPVITLISGSAPSSFQRSGTPSGAPLNSEGSSSAMSSTTGRRNCSYEKKWRTAA